MASKGDMNKRSFSYHCCSESCPFLGGGQRECDLYGDTLEYSYWADGIRRCKKCAEDIKPPTGNIVYQRKVISLLESILYEVRKGNL